MFSRGWQTRRVRVVGSAALAAALLALATACADPATAGGDSVRAPSVLEWTGAADFGVVSTTNPGGEAGEHPSVPRARIVAPATVVAGEPFTVTVVTVGASLCWEPDGAAVQVGGMIAEVTAWDRIPSGIEMCAMALGELPREVSMTFAGPGTATLRVIGRRLLGGPNDEFEPLALEWNLEVLPGGS